MGLCPSYGLWPKFRASVLTGKVNGAPAGSAIDGDPNTFILVGDQRDPAREQVDLKISFNGPVAMSGVVLMSRQNHREHEGDIRGYALQVSDDGIDWQEVARGELLSTFAPQRVDFTSPVTARYLKLISLSGFGEDKTTSLAELAVIQSRIAATGDKAPAPNSKPKPRPSPRPTPNAIRSRRFAESMLENRAHVLFRENDGGVIEEEGLIEAPVRIQSCAGPCPKSVVNDFCFFSANSAVSARSALTIIVTNILTQRPQRPQRLFSILLGQSACAVLKSVGMRHVVRTFQKRIIIAT